MKLRVLVVALASLLSVGAVVAHHGVTQEIQRAPDAIGFWSGGESFTTDPFETTGPIELTLGAWCFEGIGFVRVVAIDENGEEAGRVTVIGEGIKNAVLDTDPGEYTLEVTVSHMHIYSWEVQVEEAEAAEAEAAEVEAAEADATEAESSGAGRYKNATSEAPVSTEPVNSTQADWVEIPYAWDGTESLTTEMFESSGELDVTLGAWSSDGVSSVRVTAYESGGQEVGHVEVAGEGVQRGVISSEPGEYYLVVSSPDMNVYSWELVVRSAGTE
ncbi:MAG: hypothetical protein WD273_14470 [Trueperaceae bacterium]